MPIEKTFTIDSRHTSLPGHFPGNPIVPGVVILEGVLAQIGQSLDEPLVLSHVPSVKFHSPLRPDELCDSRSTSFQDIQSAFHVRLIQD